MARNPHLGSGQPGEAVSLSGGFIRGESSAVDVLTIQGHSAQAGDLLCVGTHNAVPALMLTRSLPYQKTARFTVS